MDMFIIPTEGIRQKLHLVSSYIFTKINQNSKWHKVLLSYEK